MDTTIKTIGVIYKNADWAQEIAKILTEINEVENKGNMTYKFKNGEYIKIISIDDEDLHNFNTVGDVVRYIEAAQK